MPLENNHKFILMLGIAQFACCNLSVAGDKVVSEAKPTTPALESVVEKPVSPIDPEKVTDQKPPAPVETVEIPAVITPPPANTVSTEVEQTVSLADDLALQEVIKLAEAGAPGLALGMMDRMQKEMSSQSTRWMLWEMQRLKIYETNQNWEDIIRKLEQLPKNISTENFRAAYTKKAQAYLQLQKGKLARETLLALILSTSGDEAETSLDWLQQWRRMIIHSYIAEGTGGDALISILRFQQDYSTDKTEILFLRARVLLMTQRPAEAVELLAKHTKEPEAGMLYLLAQLRSEQRTPVKVVQAGLRHLGGKWGDRTLRTSLWSVVAEAAQRAGDRGSAVNAIENVIADSKRTVVDKLFHFDADSLWNAYFDYALSVGNQSQLLIGQDEAWFKFAASVNKKFPIKKRAIYALLMHRGATDDIRMKAAKQFIKSIHSRRNNSQLIQQLFTQSKFYPAIADIPEPVRRALVDIALARQDIPLASQIMAGLTAPPKGKASYMWHLRRARILILGGQPRKGALALARFTQNYPKASRTQIDQFLQVVFDLQTVGEHDSAYRLFDDVIQASEDKKLQRELYYWMADSRFAQSRYADAAELYMKSAMLLDGKGWDPWGQTARYQAAKSLGKAGLIEDAYYIFQRLLKVTKEEDRRAVLRYEVQKLQLAKSESEQDDATDSLNTENNNQVGIGTGVEAGE